MKQRLAITFVIITALGIGFFFGKSMNHQNSDVKGNKLVIKYDDTLKPSWNVAFKEVLIKSSMDTAMQKAYFYPTTESIPQPLIVSLHTWSGNYTQIDTISILSKNKNWNYIHPDFRGNNVRKEACCSEYVISDIDDAIDFAIKNSNVDPGKIYVLGASGGGMATLFTFMKSKHKIRKFSAWVPVTDVEAFYKQGLIRHNKYPTEALSCAGSENNSINTAEAEKRSPLFCKTPVEKLNYSSLEIYSGIYDGIQGSVPVSHAVNMYNKILKDMNVKDPHSYVNDYEKSMLYNQLKPGEDTGSIGNRSVFLRKKYKNVQLIIFEGNHEMLPAYAFEHLGIN
jgi:hypothetical protein